MNVVASEFYCAKCGNKGLPVWRSKGKERKGGHLKKLWCLKCNQETNHVECKNGYTKEDFLLEFKYNNFDEEQNRKEKFSIFKHELIKKGVDIYE